MFCCFLKKFITNGFVCHQIIQAEGEKQAARALNEASKIMCENPTTLQLRYFQELIGIAAERNSTILFPLPIETMGGRTSVSGRTDTTDPSWM